MVYIALLGGISLPNNSAYSEFVTELEAVRRDPYMNCAPTLWAPNELRHMMSLQNETQPQSRVSSMHLKYGQNFHVKY